RLCDFLQRLVVGRADTHADLGAQLVALGAVIHAHAHLLRLRLERVDLAAAQEALVGLGLLHSAELGDHFFCGFKRLLPGDLEVRDRLIILHRGLGRGIYARLVVHALTAGFAQYPEDRVAVVAREMLPPTVIRGAVVPAVNDQTRTQIIRRALVIHLAAQMDAVAFAAVVRLVDAGQ